MNGSCQYPCNYKNAYGYCQITACINPKHNGSGTYYLYQKPQKVDYGKKYEDDDDYGIGIYS